MSEWCALLCCYLDHHSAKVCTYRTCGLCPYRTALHTCLLQYTWAVGRLTDSLLIIDY